MAARKLARQFQSHSVEVHIGGTGLNLTATLPDEIEHLMPDYDLYPECDYSFNAGLDLRLIDDQKAEILHKMKIKYIKFSWDNVRDEDLIMRGIEILRRNKINRAVFYVLVGFYSTIEEDLYRLEKLKSLGQRAYVMRYETVKGNSLYSDLAAWSNQFSFFATMTFEEYRRRRAEARAKTRKDT